MLVSGLLLSAAWVSGCATASDEPMDAVSSSPAPSQFTPSAAYPAVPQTKPTAAATPSATLARVAPPAASASSPALILKVIGPADETVVNASSITVAGQSSPGAVVSVDGALADIDAQGNFRHTVQLDEGPNILEIVASDDSGKQVSAVLRVIYEPAAK